MIIVLVRGAMPGAVPEILLPENIMFSGMAGLGAAVISMMVFRTPWWWWCINLLFPVTVCLALSLDLTPWHYLAGFVALTVVYWNVAGNRVPLYLSNRTTAQAVAGLLVQDRSLRVIDLGSGLGGIMRDLACGRPDCRFQGVENAPLPFALSVIRNYVRRLPNLVFRYGNMWSVNLESFDLVYCFLSPAPMARVFQKAKDEMRPGTIFVSNSFRVPHVLPDHIMILDDRRGTELLIWHM